MRRRVDSRWRIWPEESERELLPFQEHVDGAYVAKLQRAEPQASSESIKRQDR